MSYDVPGNDYFGNPRLLAPSWLGERARLIFRALQEELLKQGPTEDNFIMFLAEKNKTILDGEFTLSKITEGIDEALRAVEQAPEEAHAKT